MSGAPGPAGGPRLRRLPQPQPRWEQGADLVVVGSGAAGMSAALAGAGHGLRVILVSKDDLGGGATPLAQGGLAAAIGPGDSGALHQRDTLEAGAGLCDPAAVTALVAGAPWEISRLTGLGAQLDCAALHLEGGHSRNRVVHAGGDAAGAEVHRALLAALLASPVRILTQSIALDLLADGRGWVTGLLTGMIGGDGQLEPGVLHSRAVVLATGGFGQVFATTSNPAGLTGDGLAMAARAGAELRDVEFVQFHPTVLWQDTARGQCPLITEALRGAGAVLVDAAGRPVMAGVDPRGDLAPRDVVSAAMRRRMGSGDHLWLDATGLGRAALERDFPTVTGACRARGVDPVTEPIPVAPGAHYACGGIRADMDGRTSLPGLYAVGEAASTGVHGANRLASNSLTESLLAGRRAGDLLGSLLPGSGLHDAGLHDAGLHDAGLHGAGLHGAGLHDAGLHGAGRPDASLPAAVVGLPDQQGPAADRGRPPAHSRLPEPGSGVSPAGRAALAAAMSRYAGVLRDRAGLGVLLGMLARAPDGDGRLDVATVEATSLHTVSTLVAVAALARTESRGCHRWHGVPATSDGHGQHTVLRLRDGKLEIAGAAAAGGHAPGSQRPGSAGPGRARPHRERAGMEVPSMEASA